LRERFSASPHAYSPRVGEDRGGGKGRYTPISAFPTGGGGRRGLGAVQSCSQRPASRGLYAGGGRRAPPGGGGGARGGAGARTRGVRQPTGSRWEPGSWPLEPVSFRIQGVSKWG